MARIPARGHAWLGSIAAASCLLAGCGGGSVGHSNPTPSMDGSPPPEGGTPVLGRSKRGDLVFEIRKPVAGPGAPIESFNYLCSRCGPELAPDFESAALPPGFERTPWHELLAARAELRPLPDAKGEPRGIDLLASVDGDEFELGAAPQRGTFIEGKFVLVDLESDRTLAWDAGDEVHEVTDGTSTYVAFLINRGTDPAALEGLPLPQGWTHVVRTLDAPLVLDAHGAPHLFIALAAMHLWQRIE